MKSLLAKDEEGRWVENEDKVINIKSDAKTDNF